MLRDNWDDWDDMYDEYEDRPQRRKEGGWARANMPQTGAHRHDDSDCCEIEGCQRDFCRSFEISVPVTITPHAVVKDPDVNCRGGAVVRPCHIRRKCGGNSFEFTVSQIINVDIPLEFSAEICLDETIVEDRGECKRRKC